MSVFELHRIFSKDDINAFSKFDKDGIDFRSALDLSPFLIDRILQNDAPIVADCVFQGAEQCLMWILANVDTTELFDLKNRNLYHFGAASKNSNIYTVLENYLSGLDENQRDLDGMLPIHYAAMYGNLSTLQYIWMTGIDLNTTLNDDGTGIGCLHLAVMNNHPEIVEFLLSNEVSFDQKSFSILFYVFYIIFLVFF